MRRSRIGIFTFIAALVIPALPLCSALAQETPPPPPPPAEAAPAPAPQQPAPAPAQPAPAPAQPAPPPAQATPPPAQATPPPAQAAPPPAQAAPPATPAAPAPQPPAVEKATVVIDGKATSDGVIDLKVGPTPETLKSIRITVAKGMRDNDIARDVEKEVTVALGSTYKVSQSGSKVDIKAPKKQTFRITIGSVTPLGVAVKVR